MANKARSIMQGLWVGHSLTTMEKLSINSFIAHGHEYHLYVYNNIVGVPPKTVLKDANEILPFSMIFQYRQHASYAGFSNYFRYKLLCEKGGWWVDLDVVSLKPFDFDGDYVFATQKDYRNIEVATSGIIKAPKQSRALSYAFDVCCSKDTQKLVWGETGPDLIQELIPRFSLSKYVKNADTFCPIPPSKFYESLIPGRFIEFGEETYAVHLWNEMWRRLALDKDEEYSPRCLYERLKKTYLSDQG